MALVQIQRKLLRQERVPRDEDPFFELHLEENQEVVAVKQLSDYDYDRRKTVDRLAWVWVATRC